MMAGTREDGTKRAMASMRAFIERWSERRRREAQAVRVVVGVRVAAAALRSGRESRGRREPIDESGALADAQRLAAIAAAPVVRAAHTRQAAPLAVALPAEARAQPPARLEERRAQRLEHVAHLFPEVAAGHTVEPKVERVVREAQHLRERHTLHSSAPAEPITTRFDFVSSLFIDTINRNASEEL